MKSMNVFGEKSKNYREIAENICESFNTNDRWSTMWRVDSMNTLKGMGYTLYNVNTHCSLISSSFLEKGGFYVFYDMNELFDNVWYVGSSKSNVGYRIARFVKELNGKSGDNESYPAATKWSNKYGVGNFTGLFLRYFLTDDYKLTEEEMDSDNRALIEAEKRNDLLSVEYEIIDLLSPEANVRKSRPYLRHVKEGQSFPRKVASPSVFDIGV
jgi:hypothetical protein